MQLSWRETRRAFPIRGNLAEAAYCCSSQSEAPIPQLHPSLPKSTQPCISLPTGFITSCVFCIVQLHILIGCLEFSGASFSSPSRNHRTIPVSLMKQLQPPLEHHNHTEPYPAYRIGCTMYMSCPNPCNTPYFALFNSSSLLSDSDVMTRYTSITTYLPLDWYMILFITALLSQAQFIFLQPIAFLGFVSNSNASLQLTSYCHLVSAPSLPNRTNHRPCSTFAILGQSVLMQP